MTKLSKKSPSVKSDLIASMPGAAGMSNEQLLDVLADTINALRKRASEDIIEIGQCLIEAKELAGHGHWLPWLERKFGWTDKTAQRFMQVAEAVGKNDKLSNIDVPVSSLYLLAAPSTPPEAVKTVIERAEMGEKLTGADVKKEEVCCSHPCLESADRVFDGLPPDSLAKAYQIRAFSHRLVESPGGVSPPGAPRTVHEPLDSHGSRCSAVAMT